jgi:hypothetical protein
MKKLLYANPEATELLFSKKGFENGIIKVNLYNGDPNSKFKFFIATEDVKEMKRNYMVDPNNIVFETMLSCVSEETSLGILTHNKFTLCNFRTGNRRVSGESITDLYTEYVEKTLDCYLDLRLILLNAGFTITNENPEIDLRNPDKSLIISLLS